jgi:hypothetical protein
MLVSRIAFAMVGVIYLNRSLVQLSGHGRPAGIQSSNNWQLTEVGHVQIVYGGSC